MHHNKDELHAAINQIEATLHTHELAAGKLLGHVMEGLPCAIAAPAYQAWRDSVTQAADAVAKLRAFINEA